MYLLAVAENTMVNALTQVLDLRLVAHVHAAPYRVFIDEKK